MQDDGEVSLEDVRVAKAIDREAPFAVFSSAESYFLAARHLRKRYKSDQFKLRFDAPIYDLYINALELTMRAFLRAKGMIAIELRSSKFGHQPLVLWRNCLGKGLRPFIERRRHCGSGHRDPRSIRKGARVLVIEVGTKGLPADRG
jgi:hypothetical protein